MYQDFLKFITSIWGAMAVLPATFPLASELLEIIELPISGNSELIALVNSLICLFVLMLAYAYGSRSRGSLGVAAVI